MVSSISNIWFMSQPAVRICAMFVAFSRVCSSTVVTWGPGAILVQWYTLSVHALFFHCTCVVFGCSILWHCCPCRQQFLTFPSSPPPPALTAGFLVGGLFSIYLFYLFIHLFMFSSTEPFGSSLTGAQRELGARGLQLD